MRLLQDTTFVEDVTQEAFLRAWQRSATYDSARGSVNAWLLTITRNLAIDELRRRRLDVVNPETLVAEPNPTGDPSDAAVVFARIADVAQALTDLPTKDRRAVLLATYCGLTAREISLREGVPVGTAKTRIRRGLTHLKARFSEMGGTTTETREEGRNSRSDTTSFPITYHTKTSQHRRRRA
jgi:RNA polymerase sigma-70 factor (ECF subfamily)